jgi:hypothetical protein
VVVLALCSGARPVARQEVEVFSPRTAVRPYPTDPVTLRVSEAQGLRPPTLYE